MMPEESEGGSHRNPPPARPRTRVLLLVNHFPPDANPSGRLMSQLAASLRERNFSVDVLTTFPHYEGFKIERTQRGKLIERQQVGDDVVTRVWAFASGQKQKMTHRLANYLSFNALATVFGALSGRRYDVILANSGSFFTGVTAVILKAIEGAPFVYNVQDIYPDVPVRAGQLTNARAIRALERIETFMYARAARVTVISREQRTTLIGKGVPAEKVAVIPNFVDTDFIRPLPKLNDFTRANRLTDKFVVAHAGNLGFAYDFDSLLACAAQLIARTDIVFLIIGEGVKKAEIETRVANEKLSNILMLPFQPEEKLPEVRASVDVQLSLYKAGSAQTSLPSKIYEIMASGRPAIVSAEAGTELRQLIEETHSGLCIDPESTDQLCRAILELYGDSLLRASLGKNGRAAAERDYSRAVAADRYAALLSSVSQR